MHNKNNYSSAPPPPYTATGYNVQQPQQQKSSGLFGSLSKVLSDVGSTIDGAARDLTSAIDKAAIGNLMNTICRTGNIIQLSPKNYGTCIQILADPQGYLFVDPSGPCHPQAYNTHWTVYVEPAFNNIVKLYNQVNYLSVSDNTLSLVQSNTPSGAPISTRFKVRQNDSFLSLESLLCPKMYLTYDNTRNTLIAKDVNLLNNGSYFHPTLVYTPMKPVKH